MKVLSWGRLIISIIIGIMALGYASKNGNGNFYFIIGQLIGSLTVMFITYKFWNWISPIKKDK
jgi:hypothetical protein